MELAGLLIKKERLERGWSQQGLCTGICAVSYLSKLEQGKAQPSPDILDRLFERLGLQPQLCCQLSGLVLHCMESLLENDSAAFSADFEKLLPHSQQLRKSFHVIDFLLEKSFFDDCRQPLPEEYEPYMSPTQLALQRELQLDMSAAAAIDPQPHFQLALGDMLYRTGRYTEAAETLQRAYDGAAGQGLARIMLDCRITLANCHSDLGNLDRMLEHNRAALRLARALGDSELERTIRYNNEATNLELGNYQSAYEYFSSLPEPTAMELHKLSICCEKLGKTDEAMSAVQRALTLCAGSWMPQLLEKMLGLVSFRLEHPDYLHSQDYGKILLDCFDSIRAHLPAGYAVFHLPWVLEWYKANRQYRQACRLLEDFPRR